MFARPWTTVLLLTSLSLAAAPGAHGQDPPGRVGRVSVADGNVSFRSAQDTTWSAAVVNYPFVDGDRLWADQGARVEVQFDESDIHLAALTGIQAETITDAETWQHRATPAGRLSSRRRLDRRGHHAFSAGRRRRGGSRRTVDPRARPPDGGDHQGILRRRAVGSAGAQR
jgi:hypothetical protein